MQYLIPTNNEEMVMAIAKSISRERLFYDSEAVVRQVSGKSLADDPKLRHQLEDEFEILWGSLSAADNEVRIRFRNDAISAINAINVQLLLIDQ